MADTQPPLGRHLVEMARYMAWADGSVWKAVHANTVAAADTKVGDTLHHIHLVQHLFHQAWSGTTLALRDRSEFSTLDDLEAWGRDAHRNVRSFVEGATVSDLDREFRMPWAVRFEEAAKQPAQAHTLGESVLQVVLHTQHHRGQICSRLRELGGEPPTVDFIVWLWGGRP
jgi:uncharacterized damage-inducible protein DinB